ncbi:hypothetical protein [Oceanobacillus sp. J11TS1]|nr:hypothetical protein [Oceanobacillus sp. J11TS1]GIO23613.1 hypothetical protein J11TS1_21940 [Oceanobacillus sp. J11TS1]
MEKEFVGTCASCRKQIYCNNGFLEGIIQENHTLICFSCQDKTKEADPL